MLTKNAVVDEIGNHDVQVIGIDNGDPGTSDELGLKVTAPSGDEVIDLTFGPLTILGGNIQVPHERKGGGSHH